MASAQSCSASATSAPTASSKPNKSSATSGPDPGSIANGVYRNKTFGFTCKIPEGWVLRTDEMNAKDEADSGQNSDADDGNSSSAKTSPQPASSEGGRVLLAVFSRPPVATGEDVNSSILIVAESAASYPGLKEAVQYFEPLSEIAKARGFEVDVVPYEVAIETRALVRGDFHKDVASRVMHQSTLALLSHGYAVSFTVIAGTDDDVEDLIDALDFAPSGGGKK